MLEVVSDVPANLFDIMAKIFKKIDSLPKGEKETIYRRYQSNVASIDEMVENKFSFFNKELCYDSINQSNIFMLSSYIDEENSYDCFLILAYLDRYIKFEVSMRHFFDTCMNCQKGVYLFNSLNKNRSGILLPRFTPKWAKINRTTRGACNAKPFSLIKHYIWCADSGDIKVDHIYVDINSLDKDDVEEPFRIVCSPLVNKCPFEYHKGRDAGVDYFYIHNYPPDIQNVILDRIKETIHYAGDKKATVVFFPEMMIAPENRDQIIQIVKDNWEFDYPKIIYFPSSEYEDGDVWKNQIIVTNDSGNILYRYNKQRSYEHKFKKEDGVGQESCFEPITSDNKFTVLHLNKIGRVGILICADVFDETIKTSLCNTYELDVLLVAAYTSGWDSFDESTRWMSDTYCEVIVCNACSAIEDEKIEEVYPVAYYSMRHKRRELYQQKKCKNDCTGCAFCVEIPRDYNEKIDNPIIRKGFREGEE